MFDALLGSLCGLLALGGDPTWYAWAVVIVGAALVGLGLNELCPRNQEGSVVAEAPVQWRAAGLGVGVGLGLIAPSGRADKPSYHHRCARCWVRRELTRVDGGKQVELRRPATCASCSSSMARGDLAHVFSRAGWTVWLKRRGRERVRVCSTCVRLWREATAVE